MHDILSSRLARLTSAAASPEAKTFLKSELMELAKLCQIVPQNDYLLEAVAGPLTPAVRKIFGAASLIVALTEKSRRQVYFAVVAQLQATDALDALANDEDKCRHLVERMMLSGSAELITAHFGICPKGFLRLLTRIGDRARSASFYKHLHGLIVEAPDMAQELLSLTHKKTLSEDLLDVLKTMSRASRCVRLAQQFSDVTDYERFIGTYRILTGSEDLSKGHRLHLRNGGNPAHLLEALYLHLPFPSAAISAPGLRHVRNGVQSRHLVDRVEDESIWF